MSEGESDRCHSVRLKDGCIYGWMSRADEGWQRAGMRHGQNTFRVETCEGGKLNDFNGSLIHVMCCYASSHKKTQYLFSLQCK